MDRYYQPSTGESSDKKRAKIDTNIASDDIVSDPARRKSINEYEPGIRDDVRRRYVQMGPCRPTSHIFPPTNLRSFQSSWFKNWEWLEYSVSENAAFCFWCYLFGEKRAGDQAFTKNGFRNWKKAIEKFKDHVGKEGSIHNNARTLYPQEFTLSDQMELKDELKMWVSEMRSNETFSKLQNIGDLAKKMVEVGYQRTFPLVYLLIELILVLPVATATVERAFSAMNIIKSNLRNKMGDEFLTDCLVCYIEKELFTAIDNEVIIQHFQNMKTRRADLPRLRNA